MRTHAHTRRNKTVLRETKKTKKATERDKKSHLELKTVGSEQTYRHFGV